MLELRYFNNNKPEVPVVCRTALKINRSLNVIELVNQIKIHGYINGEMEERSEYVKRIKGFPLVEIQERQGKALISSLSVEKAITDPVAGKLLTNMIESVMK
ncbi:MAG: hypothetical protein LBG96_16900 [Tannerella sp.]|nr:hypothetical protein [Tannerella sp.]